MSRFKADDIDLLLPSFAVKVRAVIAAMQARGYETVPFDTVRTPKEAAKFAARGVGSVNSMHIYGAACDCICGQHGWNCAASGCKFFAVYGECVEAAGLAWGGRFPSRHDLPHMQAIPVRLQDVFRRLKPEDRDAFCRKAMGQ